MMEEPFFVNISSSGFQKVQSKIDILKIVCLLCETTGMGLPQIHIVARFVASFTCNVERPDRCRVLGQGVVDGVVPAVLHVQITTAD